MMIPRPWNLHDPVYLPRRRSRRNRISSRSRRPKPEYDKNIVSAFFSLATAVLLAIAEAEPKWIKIIGGKCSGQYLGLYKVIAYSSSSDLAFWCYSSSMVTKFRVIVALCCGAIVFSMFACLLDLCGTRNCFLKILKDNSVGNILSVLLCVSSSGLAYWISVDLFTPGNSKQKEIKGKFDVSFYLVVAAGVCAVLATALSLVYCQRQPRQRTLSEEEMSMELMCSRSAADSIVDVPPPAYRP